MYVGRTTGADCPDQCCPLDHSLHIIHKYTRRSTDRSFVLKHKLFGNYDYISDETLKSVARCIIIRCNPVCNFLKLLFNNFVQPDSVETWAKVAKLSKLKTKKLEIFANRCIAADLGQIEHIRKTFVQSIELLQISGQRRLF